jgi:hypothetical protein
MSAEHVELIRRQIEAFNRHDWEGSIEGIDPEVEWVVTRFRDGLIVKVEEYLDPEEARQAA